MVPVCCVPYPFPPRPWACPSPHLPWVVQMWSWQPQHMLPWRQLPGKKAAVGMWNPCREREVSLHYNLCLAGPQNSERPQPHQQRETEA